MLVEAGALCTSAVLLAVVLAGLGAMFARDATPGRWLGASVVVAWLVQLRWVLESERAAAPAVLGVASVGAVLIGALAQLRSGRSSTSTWVSAAVCPVLFLPVLVVVFERSLGQSAVALVPAALAIATGLSLRVASRGESRSTSSRRALALGAAAILLAFVALNFAILDFFTTSSIFRLSLDRLPARDLALSLSWALFGVAILVLGTLRRSAALRKLSLVILVVTCIKVFAYDSSRLADLYRVSSLVGLAAALLAASLLYHRYVVPRLGEETG